MLEKKVLAVVIQAMAAAAKEMVERMVVKV